MIKTIQENEFTDILIKMEYSSFSYYGAKALFKYLEELEQDFNEPIEFDYVAIRCQYSEIDNLKEFLKGYDNINDLEELREHTTVIEFDKGYIVDTEF